jgi:hypothetical protein
MFKTKQTCLAQPTSLSKAGLHLLIFSLHADRFGGYKDYGFHFTRKAGAKPI